jgi:hypothetical protein
VTTRATHLPDHQGDCLSEEGAPLRADRTCCRGLRRTGHLANHTTIPVLPSRSPSPAVSNQWGAGKGPCIRLCVRCYLGICRCGTLKLKLKVAAPEDEQRGHGAEDAAGHAAGQRRHDAGGGADLAALWGLMFKPTPAGAICSMQSTRHARRTHRGGLWWGSAVCWSWSQRVLLQLRHRARFLQPLPPPGLGRCWSICFL